MTTEVIIEQGEDPNEQNIAAVQAAATIAAAESAGAAAAKADQAGEEAAAARAEAELATAQSGAASSLAADTAERAVTIEQVNQAVDDGMSRLAAVLAERLAAQSLQSAAPAPPVAPPKDPAPKSIKGDKLSFAERFYGKKKKDDE